MASHPNPRGDAVNRMGIGVGVVLAVVVGLRFLARWRSKASFAADDWFIAASLVPLYGMIVTASFMVNEGGAGRHFDTLNIAEIRVLLKTTMVALTTYAMTITLVKISLLLLYRRVFDNQKFKTYILVVGALCLSWFVAGVFSNIFQCSPVSAAFDERRMLPDVHCLDLKAWCYGVTASNMLLDIIILAMPISMVWQLRLPTRQKVILSGIFLLGGGVCIASLMRLLTLAAIKPEDFSYTIPTAYIWSQVEPGAAILCACITTYRPLFKNLNLQYFSSWSMSRSRQSGFGVDEFVLRGKRYAGGGDSGERTSIMKPVVAVRTASQYSMV